MQRKKKSIFSDLIKYSESSLNIFNQNGNLFVRKTTELIKIVVNLLKLKIYCETTCAQILNRFSCHVLNDALQMQGKMCE